MVQIHVCVAAPARGGRAYTACKECDDDILPGSFKIWHQKDKNYYMDLDCGHYHVSCYEKKFNLAKRIEHFATAGLKKSKKEKAAKTAVDGWIERVKAGSAGVGTLSALLEGL